MYARKTTFVTKSQKKTKQRFAKVSKNGLQVGKSRKNHKNTPYTLNNAHKTHHRCINTKKPLQ